MTTDYKNSATPADSQPTDQAETENAPIIVDMGKKSRKDIRKLRKGKPGKLMRRVAETLDHLKENGALAADAQPVVIVIRQRERKGLRRGAKMWGLV